MIVIAITVHKMRTRRISIQIKVASLRSRTNFFHFGTKIHHQKIKFLQTKNFYFSLLCYKTLILYHFVLHPLNSRGLAPNITLTRKLNLVDIITVFSGLAIKREGYLPKA